MSAIRMSITYLVVPLRVDARKFKEDLELCRVSSTLTATQLAY